MKTLPEQYQCEICKRTYTTKEAAVDCESKGEGPRYPVGLIFGNHSEGAFYLNITFSVAKIVLNNHCNDSPLWACRDNGAGDSLGKEMCGGGSYLGLNEHHAKIDFNHPTFKRMVAYLTKEKIPITIWDGEKAIPYLQEA